MSSGINHDSGEAAGGEEITMGWYVHLNVCFACDNNDGVAELANHHMATFLGDGEHREAEWFLNALSLRSGFNPGSKGGLSTWGIIGNYTNGTRFVDVLRPFWKDLLRDNDIGPCCHEHILVFVEHEQSERATAFEIFLEDDADPDTLIVKEHECPFSWMQM